MQESIDQNREASKKFQKKYAVDKAVEVIKLFEKIAESDAKIDMKKFRKRVFTNLVDANRNLEKNDTYWSMQLLIKLGLVPDPEDTTLSADGTAMRASSMTAEDREAKMKEIGLELPKKKMAEFNR